MSRSNSLDKVKYVILTICTIASWKLFIVTSYAQTEQPNFNSLTTESGLSQSIINAIYKDKTGFIWIGTADGLNRYDGHNLKIFKHDKDDSTSISNNDIKYIHEDANGLLWVGTVDGYNLFDPASGTFKRFYFDDNREIRDYVQHLYQDKQNRVWITVQKKGVFCIESHPDTVIITPFFLNNQPNKSTLDVMGEDKDGNLLIREFSNINILYAYNPKTKQLTKILEQKRIWSVLTDKEYNIWMTGFFTDTKGETYDDETILRYNQKTKESTFFPTPSKTLRNSLYDGYHPGLLWDSDGNIWKGDLVGLYLFDTKKEKYTKKIPLSGPLNGLKSIMIDKDQLIWMGLGGNGVKWLPLWDLGAIEKLSYENNLLTFSSVRAIHESEKDIVWIGGYGGLNRYNRKTKQTELCRFLPGKGLSQKNAEALSISSVYKIFPDIENSEKYLWISYEGPNFHRINKEDLTISDVYNFDEFQDNRIKDVLIDNNHYWFVTLGGLVRCDSKMKNRKFFLNSLSDFTNNNSIELYSVTKISEQYFYVASSLGLLVFDLKEEKFVKKYSHNPKDPKSLSNNFVTHISKDSKQQIWVATKGGGLNLFDPISETFEAYTQKDGLPNDVVYTTLEDKEGKLWMSTNNGISCFDPQTKTFQNFDISDGLQDNEFNWKAFEQSPSGRLYFGGIKGVNSFMPEQLVTNSIAPNVILTSVKKMNKELSFSKAVYEMNQFEFKHSDRIISFEFAALNFHNSHKNQYAYKLEGLQANWINIGNNNTVTFQSLNPGTYTLYVKATTNNKVWSEQILKVKIKVAPPWWLTWWAKTLSVLVAIALLYAVYIIRFRWLESQRRTLENEVKNKTKNIEKQKEEIQKQAEELKLQADELKTSNEKLVELDSFKEDMTGMLVHDLKNPLNTIVHSVQDYNPENNQIIKQAGNQLNNMVSNILDVYKYESSQMIVEQSEINLYEVANKAIDNTHILIHNKSINLSNKIDISIRVKGDYEVLLRVFANLLTNAIKYTPINGKISLTSALNDNEMVSIRVTDSGKGIAPENLDKIFNKFSQVEAKKSGAMRSTGLGLTFCKMAIEAHKGEINVESEVGKGTSFIFTLPLSRITQVETTSKTPEKQKNEISLELSVEEKKLLKPILADLSNTLVFEISKVKIILKKIEKKTPNIEKWEKEIDNSTLVLNEERYNHLIKIAMSD